MSRQPTPGNMIAFVVVWTLMVIGIIAVFHAALGGHR